MFFKISNFLREKFIFLLKKRKIWQILQYRINYYQKLLDTEQLLLNNNN